MEGELTGIDLRADEHKEVVRLLQHHLPDTEVWAYGSRVKGNARPASDLDLVTFASAGQNEAVSRLREAFDESALPFRVGLFVWDNVPEEFRKNIEETRVVVQEKKHSKNPPNNWKILTLSKIINLIGGGTPKRSKQAYWNGNIPWLSVKDFNNQYRYVDSAEETITELGEQESSTRVLKTGQLIISARGTVGALAQLTQPMAFNQSCYGIDAKREYTDNDFLYYLVKHSIDNLKQITHGAVFDTITRETFNHIEVSLPPPPEQKAIAHILGSLDDKIELNRRMNETLEAMAQAMFKSWFVDFDPVIDNALAAGNTIPDELKEKACLRRSLGRQAAIRQGLDDKRKSLPDDIRRLFPSEFAYTEEMGWIPKGWEVGPLRLIATYCSDRIPTSELTLENYISTDNMLAEKKGICTAAKLPTVKTTSSYQSGNVLVSNIRPYFKKIWFADGSGGCSNDILNFTVKELNTEEYLLNLLWQDTFFDYMMTTAKGSKMPRGDKDAILNWKIIIPPVKSRRLFAEIVRGFYKQISGKYKINTSLCKFSDKLLTRLLSGEIYVTGFRKLEGG